MAIIDLPAKINERMTMSTSVSDQPAPRVRPSARRPLRVIASIAAREIKDALRNRWLVAFAVCFALLSGALALLTRSAAGDAGTAGFGRTAAGLINLVMVLVPLMSMTAAASSIAGERERGMLTFLLAQPVSLTQVILGKFIGLSLAVTAAVLLGFGIGATIIAGAGGSDAWAFAKITMLTAVLAVAMVSVGIFVVSWCRRSSTATTAVLLTWLGMVFACDLILMGSHIAMKLPIATLFHAALANPLQAFKFAALQPLGGSLDVLGPPAAWAGQVYGNGLIWVLTGALSFWVIAPLVASLVVMRRRGAP